MVVAARVGQNREERNRRSRPEVVGLSGPLVLRACRVLGLLILLMVVTAQPLCAQATPAGGLQARLIVSDEPVAVGDVVELTVEVLHPTGSQVILPLLGPVWGEFEVRSQARLQTVENGDGTSTTRQALRVTLFRPGEFVTPPFLVSVGNVEGEVVQLTAAPVSVRVASVLAEGDTTLRDIKPQAAAPTPLVWPAVTGGILAGVALAAVGLGAVRRRRAAQHSLDNRPPDQMAREELAQIHGAGLAGQGRYKEHYALVTDCLRRYLARQYGVSTQERTTGELMRLLRETAMSDSTAALCNQFFGEADLVKFAAFDPSPAAAAALVHGALQVVDQAAGEAAAQRAAAHPEPALSTSSATDAAADG